MQQTNQQIFRFISYILTKQKWVTREMLLDACKYSLMGVYTQSCVGFLASALIKLLRGLRDLQLDILF